MKSKGLRINFLFTVWNVGCWMRLSRKYCSCQVRQSVDKRVQRFTMGDCHSFACENAGKSLPMTCLCNFLIHSILMGMRQEPSKRTVNAI